ncbi:MAG: stage II sporulation protein D [Chlamydiales bacterium]|jgi:stage II sporulation protein D
MIIRILFTLCLLLGHGSALHAQTWEKLKSTFGMEEVPEPAKIKVLINPLVDGALLEIKGAYNIFNPLNGERLGTRFFKKSRFVQPQGGGLKWGEEFPGIFQVAFVPDDESTTILINGIEYRGSVYVYQIGNDKISVVNEVDIEDYVKSTLGVMLDEPSTPEAMAAISIIARTDAHFQRERNLGKFWHITAKDADYRGFAVTFRHNGVDASVDATKHLVMNDVVNGGPFPARWTENSGGKTASYQAIFRQGMPGPQNGVEAPYSAMSRAENTWSYTISREDLARKAKLGNISDLKVFRDRESERVYALRLNDGFHSRDVGFLSLQKILGKNNVQSSDFTLSLEDGMVIFEGYGKGHGVGLCLYSAEIMADKGDDASKILSAFFPDVFISMAEEVLPSTNRVGINANMAMEASEAQEADIR